MRVASAPHPCLRVSVPSRGDELNAIVPHLSAPGAKKPGDAGESNTGKKPEVKKPDP